MKMRVEAIGRLIIEAVLFVNVILTSLGKNPLPIDESMAYQVVSYIAAGVAALWAWWKNNNITETAVAWQPALEFAKQNKEKAGGEGDPLEVE